MKLTDIRLFLTGSLLVFLGGFSLQVSLFHQISRQQRNATAINTSSVPTTTTQTNALESRPQQQDLGRCAINLYGLPRAFKSLVLPSLIKNVIRSEYSYHFPFLLCRV